MSEHIPGDSDDNNSNVGERIGVPQGVKYTLSILAIQVIINKNLGKSNLHRPFASSLNRRPCRLG